MKQSCKYEEFSSTTIDKLKLAQKSTDIETSHYDADNALCELLNELGYENIVKEYEKVRKWYA